MSLSRHAWSAAALALFLSLTTSSAAHAQQSGAIRGTISDSVTRAPVTGAQVSVAGTSRVAVTDARGEYRLADVPAGAARVRVQRIGYVPGELRSRGFGASVREGCAPVDRDERGAGAARASGTRDEPHPAVPADRGDEPVDVRAHGHSLARARRSSGAVGVQERDPRPLIHVVSRTASRRTRRGGEGAASRAPATAARCVRPAHRSPRSRRSAPRRDPLRRPDRG